MLSPFVVNFRGGYPSLNVTLEASPDETIGGLTCRLGLDQVKIKPDGSGSIRRPNFVLDPRISHGPKLDRDRTLRHYGIASGTTLWRSGMTVESWGRRELVKVAFSGFSGCSDDF